MPPMQILRNAHTLARFVLVWFALSVGVAIASPMVKPQAMQMVCSSAGAIKVVATDADTGSAPATNTLDCPLCAGLGGVPPFVAVAFGAAPPQRYVPTAQTSSPVLFAPVAPLPPRGPPANA